MSSKTNKSQNKPKSSIKNKSNTPKKEIIYTTIGILISLIVFASSSYAFWTHTTTQEDSNIVETVSCLDITMQSHNNDTINLENSYPMTTGNALKSGKYEYSFTIKNNCGKAQDYVIAIRNADNVDLNNQIDYKYISAALDKVGMGKLSDMDSIANPNNENNAGRIIGYGSLAANETKTRTIDVWINEDADNSIMNKQFKTNIYIAMGQYEDGTPIVKKTHLAQMLRENADTDTTIDFNVQSSVSGTNGIYATTNTDNGEPVYYYRGTVDNNLKFAGFCWKIIRTTETGGTKILYNGTPNASGACTAASGNIGSSAYNENIDDNTYVGYMTGAAGASTYATTHSNIDNSTIKTMIDTWYENNLKDYAVYLEDIVYCNDRNLVKGTTNNRLGTSYGVLGYGKNATGYGALARSNYFTLNANPSLVCKNTTGYVPEDNDAFTVSSIIGNGKLKYPVGLITTDEVVYAGMNTKGDKSATTDSQDSNYLSSGNYWTMSPSCMNTHDNAYVSRVYSSYTHDNRVDGGQNVRPVVSLRPSTLIMSGNGTQDNPYIVK